MGWEDPTYIEDFNTSPPGGPLPTDPKSEGDDHIRSIKNAINASFPNTTGPWNTTSPVGVGTAVNPEHAARLDQIPAPQPTLYAVSSWGVLQGGTGTVSKDSGTDDFTLTWRGTGWWQIDFDDAATDTDSQVVLVTLIATSSSSGSGLVGTTQPRYISPTEIWIYNKLSDAFIDGSKICFQRIRY